MEHDLSALERAILGVLSVSGPCTAYAVRREFVRSPSSHWSGSAGAVYPALTRLERAGLVRSAAVKGSARRARHYRPTAAGRRALKSWLTSAVDAEEAAYGFDPVRLRIFFFGALTAAERRAVADDAIRGLEEALESARRHEAELAAEGPSRGADARFARLGREGARRLLEARLDWFRAFRREL